MSTPTRPYRQVARAASAEALRGRIVSEFIALFGERWLDDITLDDLAARAGTTRQTVIRFFGGKDGLVDALADAVNVAMDHSTKPVPAVSLRQFAAAQVAAYESYGALIVHALAQEQRHASLGRALARGRMHHRSGLRISLAPWLDSLPGGGANRMEPLVAATDVYLWQLLRRDLKHPPEQVARTMHMMLAALLAPVIPTDEGDSS